MHRSARSPGCGWGRARLCCSGGHIRQFFFNFGTPKGARVPPAGIPQERFSGYCLLGSWRRPGPCLRRNRPPLRGLPAFFLAQPALILASPAPGFRPLQPLPAGPRKGIFYPIFCAAGAKIFGGYPQPSPPPPGGGGSSQPAQKKFQPARFSSPATPPRRGC